MAKVKNIQVVVMFCVATGPEVLTHHNEVALLSQHAANKCLNYFRPSEPIRRNHHV